MSALAPLMSNLEMEYLVDLWTETNTTMPTVKQLRYLLYLVGGESTWWQQESMTRREVGSIIHKVRKALALPS